MGTQSLKKYYEDGNVTLELERNEGRIFLHVKVRKWSLSISKHCYSVLNTLFEDMKDSGYTEAFSVTPNPKFAAMFGADSIHKFTHEEKEYEVVKWDLK
jgi:hypothetical protein